MPWLWASRFQTTIRANLDVPLGAAVNLLIAKNRRSPDGMQHQLLRQISAINARGELDSSDRPGIKPEPFSLIFTVEYFARNFLLLFQMWRY